MADPLLLRYRDRALGSLPQFRRVTATCGRCGRRNEVPVAYLIMVGKIDPRTTLATFAASLRCSICNSRRVAVSLEAPPGGRARPAAASRRR